MTATMHTLWASDTESSRSTGVSASSGRSSTRSMAARRSFSAASYSSSERVSCHSIVISESPWLE
jgi:hypothetical protein